MEELHDKGFQIFAYADDLAIMGRNKSNLEDAINIVEQWTARNLMQINRRKSGIIFFKRKLSKYNNYQKILEFPVVREYKYLGIYIDEKLNFAKQIEATEAKIEKGMKMVRLMKWKKTTL